MSDATAIHHLTRALELIRDLDPDAPISLVLVFLCVAREAGLTGRELQKHVGVAQSTISRHTLSLGEYSYIKGKPGLQLIERVDDPRDLRLKRYFLTTLGQRLIVRLLSTLSPTEAPPKAEDFPTYKEWQKSGARWGT